MLAGSWTDFVGDLAVYHTAWAELFKVKKRKAPQDTVELAYHLAHSGVYFFSRLTVVLQNILRCPTLGLDQDPRLTGSAKYFT